MDEKRSIDAFGAALLIAIATILAFNQVAIKVAGGGFNPVFQAGLRSAGALVVVLVWMQLRRSRIAISGRALVWGVVSGLLFAVEFVSLYISLDLTTVSRASIIFYSMPVWLALAAHLWLPGERLNRTRALGLVLAMAGVAAALLDRGGGHASLAGDLLALVAALGWGSIALCLRMTPLSQVRPETQLLVQLAVSAPVLLVLSPLFGPLLRDPQALHWAGLGYQILFVAGLGYLTWFWLMTVYRAGGVASFSFLSPVLAVIMGWAILDETIGAPVWAALGLVAAGVFLINRR